MVSIVHIIVSLNKQDGMIECRGVAGGSIDGSVHELMAL